ncbi:unnamed protein product, partial [marine sediment metagenome]
MHNKEISDRFDKIEGRQSEFRDTLDTVLVNQASGIKQLNEIHTFLAGTEYDDNGGLVSTVSGMKKKVQANTLWRIRITAAASVVAAIFGGVI